MPLLHRKDRASKPREDPLRLFLPIVASWFRENVGAPTAPQAGAWPLIARGEHVLIHAPTGSGKTFAAFLWAINGLFVSGSASPEEKRVNGAGRKGVRKTPANAGVQVLYISPLKALNNDIERNLRDPLSGIRRAAEARAAHDGAEPGRVLPEISVAVRTGDTPPNDRAAMVRNPPHVLITTPESLYLLLTSPQARDILRTVHTVIVDEIHTLCPNKRGSHLALSLERLERLSPGFQRIGLSATQKPLEEVARFLGGQAVEEEGGRLVSSPRPVSIVDAPYAKRLELEVLGMPEQAEAESSGSLWTGVIPRLLSDVRAHKTTLIFCNSRRQAERTADRMNTQWAAERDAQASPGPEVFEGPVHGGQQSPRPVALPAGEEWKLYAGIMGGGEADGPFRAHHSSVSEEVRRQLEKDLKAGVLPALVGTSSLELGIDIGSVELVVHIGSPRAVTQGLQRVGRSGHKVGDTSRGRIYATHNEDLVESAAVAKGMLAGEVEELSVPRNALDVLAQQVVAAVSGEDPASRPGQGWRTDDLYRLARQAYPYENLTRESFESVLKLVSGKYPRHLFSALKARIHWDEANGVLHPLPSARLTALNNSGAIVDRGAFPVYLADRETRLGELDEEFVWETRPGDAFMLGSQVWRATDIEDDRVIVEPAPGALPRMPFWRGDIAWRPLAISNRLAAFRAEIARRLAPHVDEDDDPPAVMRWLMDGYHLDEPGARQVVGYIRRQLRAVGAVSSDNTVIVETYQDPVGDRRLVVHSPFGGRVNAPWAIALQAALQERTGVRPEMQVGDDGIMFRFPEADIPPPVEIIEEMDAAQVRERVLLNLSDSAMFGAVFRQNAYRALLLPGLGRGKRTPFWLQRLKAKDLLSIAKAFPDFPILLESYRDCLEDLMDVPGLEKLIGGIQRGDVRVVHVESRTPSPVAEALSFGFTAFYMYEWDAPKAERSMQTLRLDRAALAALFKDPSFAGVLKPEAIEAVTAEASHSAPGRRARSATELVQIIEELGDLTEDEIADRCEGDAAQWLAELEAGGRVGRISVPARQPSDSPAEQLPLLPETRWVSVQAVKTYEAALGQGAGGTGDASLSVLKSVLRKWLARSGPVTLSEAQARYPVPPSSLDAALDGLAQSDEAVWGYFTPGAGGREWADSRTLAAIQSRTLSVLRAEVSPVSPLRWQAEVARLHGVASETKGRGVEGVRRAVETLVGAVFEPDRWTSEVLPARVQSFSVADLEALFKSEEFIWVATVIDDGRVGVRILPRGTGGMFLSDAELAGLEGAAAAVTGMAAQVRDFLASEGVASSSDLRSALTGLSSTGLRDALRDLAQRGLVTADSWSALAAMSMSQAAPDSENRPAVLATSGTLMDRRDRSALRRDTVRRLREASLAVQPDVKWSLTSRFAVMGTQAQPGQRAEARAMTLLKRYGVVSRRTVESEGGAWAWRPIEGALALMELRGAARRGFFVHGLPGVQYALPGAVESLRGRRGPSGGVSLLAATDPSFVLDKSYGYSAADAPLLKFNRLSSTFLALAGDRPVLLAERYGEAVTASQDPALQEAVVSAVAALRGRLLSVAGHAGRVTVLTWNGGPVLKSRGAEALTRAGFARDYPGMSFDSVRAMAAGVRPG